MLKKTCEKLSAIGTIKDISMYFMRGTSIVMPFGMKILFIKNPETEIPNFINIGDEAIGLFWKGCAEACNFCKKMGHWKSCLPRNNSKRAP